MKNFVTDLYYSARFKFNNIGCNRAPKKERGDQLIASLGLIIVSLIVLVVFRKQLLSWCEDVIQQISDYLGELFAGKALDGGDLPQTNPTT